MITIKAPITSTLVFIVPAKAQDFTIRVVSKGQTYGLDNCLVHDSLDPLVEFYATKWASEEFGVFGQFCSRLSLSSLLKRESLGTPWQLDLSIPSWHLTASEMDYIKGVLAHQVSQYAPAFDQA
jgi:hypothetical protein